MQKLLFILHDYCCVLCMLFSCVVGAILIFYVVKVFSLGLDTVYDMLFLCPDYVFYVNFIVTIIWYFFPYKLSCFRSVFNFI